MRDLYKRLGIGKHAMADEISTAIEMCGHTTLKAEAATVLKVRSRRDEYDKLHTLLCDIGRLRARLGLTHGQYWQGDVANDFSLPPDNARSRHEALVSKISEAVALHDAFPRWKRLLPWCIAAGAVALSIAILAMSLLMP